MSKQKTEQLPLAIKYRPNSLSQVVGQDHVVNSIRGFVAKKRIPNTILISGPYGSGKTTLARLVNLYINCEELIKGEPCRKCSSCKSSKLTILGVGDHPDLKELDAATNRGIEDMRGLQKIAELSPTHNYRVIILDECQEITPVAWKANLKTLEHPPGHTKFILCTTDPEKLPPAIISRGFRLALNKVSTKSLSQLLSKIAKKEGFPIKKKTRLRLVDLSGNHPRDALQLLESALNYMEYHGVEPTNLEKHFPKIFSQSEVYKTYIAVQNWWTAVFAGKFDLSFFAIDEADNLVFFLDQAILVWRNIIRQWINPKLVDRSKLWALKKVKFPDAKTGRNHIKDAASILNKLVTAQAKVKSFQHDAHAVIEQVTMDIVLITKKWS